MSPDLLFRICGLLAQIGWILLILFGRKRWVSAAISGLVIPALIGIVYMYAVVGHWHEHQGGFSSLAQVQLLFTNRWLVLAGWVHYLAFDLFLGSWETRDAKRVGISHWLVIPCLVLTFLFGPIGFLLYLVLKGTFTTLSGMSSPSAKRSVST